MVDFFHVRFNLQIQVPHVQKTVSKSEEDVHRGPLKDYEKSSHANESNSSDAEPLAKKRRTDTESVDPIDAKLNEIRDNIKSEDQPIEISDTSVEESPKKKSSKGKNKYKNKNKSKNKSMQQMPATKDNQTDFDYGAVDFKKFGGGSISEQKNDIKMKFHGKVSVYFVMLKLIYVFNIFK